MSKDHTDAVFFEDGTAFEAWPGPHASPPSPLLRPACEAGLAQNAAPASRVWIRRAKKGTGVPSIDWTTAVDVALCFGWIDGIARRLDDEGYVQRVTPRRARSVWSAVKRERIEG